MIRLESIAEQRLRCANNCVQEVIEKAEKHLTQNGRQLTPSARCRLNKGAPEEIANTYHQYVKSFAMLVLNSGLTAALLFTLGKANKEKNEENVYQLIIKHLTKWLNYRGHVQKTGQKAIKCIYEMKSAEIRCATLEAIRFLEDLKRVADARLYHSKNNKKDE
ncbi:MAG: type III-B CRISPR module-associated protein Cmr5 [Saprospiraceae bacterium]|nr:type III-B CRISPR module-associated protein Cmr5 [Saprospiraceae bacterium]MDW8485086.1 type III-B CRISPR module-associated protein Cmr5 [Saprospiraceae bacterium]